MKQFVPDNVSNYSFSLGSKGCSQMKIKELKLQENKK